MPDVLIEAPGDWLKERKAEFIGSIADSIGAVLGTPKDDKILRLIEHQPENFSIPRSASKRFTHVEITVFEGRSVDSKRDLYRTIVKNLGPFEVPPNDVKIVLIEVSRSEVGMRGGAACDLEIGYEISL